MRIDRGANRATSHARHTRPGEAAGPARSDSAGGLAAGLGLAPGGPAGNPGTPTGPPTVAAFLRNAYRPPTSEVSDAAVAAALANVRGEQLPAARTAAHDALPTAAPAPVADAPLEALPDPRTRAALHPALLRTRALSAPPL